MLAILVVVVSLPSGVTIEGEGVGCLARMVVVGMESVGGRGLVPTPGWIR